MADMFGYEIKKKKKPFNKETLKSFVPPTSTEDAGIVTAGGHYAQPLVMDGGRIRNEADLIYRYRDVAEQPEADAAIDDIVNEAIIHDSVNDSVSIRLDRVNISDNIKIKIFNEYTEVLRLLGFNIHGNDIFRRWYVDGRVSYHAIIDSNKPKQGISELRYVDPTKLTKIKEIEKQKDQKTGVEVIVNTHPYFIYKDEPDSSTGLKINPDAIIYAHSGQLDAQRLRVVSYLNKAIKPINQLRMMEDAVVIYRIARAPERRIFYVDVGNLPKNKAEEYLTNIMTKYRNKLVYDASTGQVTDDSQQMSMLEDFFLPRREGGRGTEVSTLSGGENLGQIDDIIYFQRKVYQSLNVPTSRLEQANENAFSVGRSGEITRDEIKFKRFIDKLRARFSDLFLQILRLQLISKSIITEAEWEEWKNLISFDYVEDNNYAELKANEVLQGRFEMLASLDEYVGKYVSNEWVRKNILRQNEEEIAQINAQMKAEEGIEDDDDEFGFDAPKSADDVRFDNDPITRETDQESEDSFDFDEEEEDKE